MSSSPTIEEGIAAGLARAPVRGRGDDDDDDESSEEEENEAEDDDAGKKPKAKGKKRKAGRPKGSLNKKGRKSKEPGGEPKKRQNFTELEDLNICKAWKSISQHPIIGANQTGTLFWTKVKEAFDELMLRESDDEIIPRTRQAILDRFQRRIARMTQKFNACFLFRKRLNESGKTIDDIINDAMEDFKVKNKAKAFPFRHCLEVLWSCPQFDVEGDYVEADADRRSSLGTDRRSSTGTGTGTGDFEHEEGNLTATANDVTKTVQAISFARPGGSKSSKAYIDQARRKEYWNQKKHKEMVRLTHATNRSANILQFAATQNAISARVGHLILLGDKEKARQLLQETEDMVVVPDDGLIPVPAATASVGDNDEDDYDEEDEEEGGGSDDEDEDV